MKRQKKWTAAFCSLVLVFCAGACGRQEVPAEWMSVEQSTSLCEENKTSEPACVGVYVCGAVQTPGVYFLTEEDRVADAVEQAGGFLEEADKNALNLAAKPKDGEKLYVPTIGESESRPAENKININTADEKTLMQLPGIGESRAGDILRYREKNGPFSECEDIMKVSGIKESTYEQICDRITVN